MRRAVGLGLVLWIAAGAPVRAAVSVVVTPAQASLPANGTQQFAAEVFGTTNKTVRWLVNGVAGGAPSIGVISDAGLYTAPPDAPQTLSVAVEAEPQAAPASPGSASVSVAAGPTSGSSFYVATTGDDANPGTQAAPWRTIQHGVETVPAGASILVESGVYNELVTIRRSGSASAGFLTLAAAPGAHPILDGTGLGVPDGQYGLVTIDNASWVRVKGFEIRNYVSRRAALVPIGVYVEGAGDHIEILSNHIHAITTTVTTSAGDALGIAVYGTKAPASINWLTIDGNELDHLITGFSESLSLSGNVEIWQVTGNLIHDNDNIGVNIEGFFKQRPIRNSTRRGAGSSRATRSTTSRRATIPPTTTRSGPTVSMSTAERWSLCKTISFTRPITALNSPARTRAGRRPGSGRTTTSSITASSPAFHSGARGCWPMAERRIVSSPTTRSMRTIRRDRARANCRSSSTP